MRAIHVFLGILLLLPAAFCGFGFLASFEAVPHALIWKIGYAGLGIAFLAGSLTCMLRPFLRVSDHSRPSLPR